MFRNTPQGKYINRHNIKLSYSTTRNIKSHISASNSKKFRSSQVEPNEQCKFAKKNIQCPVSSNCMSRNIVYEAKVKTRCETKSYIGMNGRTFISRWKEHRGNFRHKNQKGTKLSNYIWKLKDFGENIKFEDIEWSIKSKSVPYKPGARYCDTCLGEKTHIALENPADILNSRKEIVSKCPHKKNFELCFYKSP